jgi:hypothetical protein
VLHITPKKHPMSAFGTSRQFERSADLSGRTRMAIDGHRTIKPHPHHLRNPACIVAVGLVDLRLQHRPHVPRLDTDHRQTRFGKRAVKPLRQRPGFQSNSLEVIGRVFQHRQQSFWFARHFYFSHDPACLIHNADAGLLD